MSIRHAFLKITNLATLKVEMVVIESIDSIHSEEAYRDAFGPIGQSLRYCSLFYFILRDQNMIHTQTGTFSEMLRCLSPA